MRALFFGLVVCTAVGCLDLSEANYRFGSADASLGADGGSNDGGLDGGCAVTCVPPAPFCNTDTTLVVSRTRGCSGTQCQFEQSSATCTSRCTNGACENEPCAGVVCDLPPPSTCADAQTLKVYASSGTCSNGTCSYTTVNVPCPNGCANAACVGNPCAGKTCNLPPASTCVGSSVRTYLSPGVCDGHSGACVYSSTDTPCSAGCSNGSCLNDACAGVLCTTPPPPVCTAPAARRVYSTSGTCSQGLCSYASTIENCPNGDSCDGGVCQSVPTCTASNCSFGCCQGTTCVLYAQQSPATCGSVGAACAACDTGFQCSIGLCVDPNPCHQNNGGCDAHATCAPGGTGGRTCVCNAGYEGDGLSCTSVPDAGTPRWVLRQANTPDAGSAAPSPRRSVAMAYDPVNRVSLVFGGYDGVTNFNETWSWNGSTWARLSTTGPSPRRLAAMTYDTKRNTFVLFGGWDGTTVSSDTWEWADSGWKQVATTGPGRYGAVMVYDPARQVSVLFGGSTSATTSALDTWLWNGATWVNPISSTGIGANISPPMVYSTVLQRPVVVGTNSAGGSSTWALGDNSWLVLDAGPPPDRIGTAFAFYRKRFVVYGGQSSLVSYGDTQEWDGSRWQVALSNGPAPRMYVGSALDSARDRLVMFGGLLVDGGVTNELWEYTRE